MPQIKLGDISVEVVFKDIKNIHLSVPSIPTGFWQTWEPGWVLKIVEVPKALG